MPKKRFTAEQIVVVLRQIEVMMSQGNATEAITTLAHSQNMIRKNEDQGTDLAEYFSFLCVCNWHVAYRCIGCHLR